MKTKSKHIRTAFLATGRENEIHYPFANTEDIQFQDFCHYCQQDKMDDNDNDKKPVMSKRTTFHRHQGCSSDVQCVTIPCTSTEKNTLKTTRQACLVS